MAEIELHPGIHFCTTNELNRIARQQGLCLAIAQASVFDEICQAVSLPADAENEIVQSFLDRNGLNDSDQLDQYLEQEGWSIEDLVYFATKAKRLEIFKQQLFLEEVELRFLERKTDLDQIHYSLIRVRDGNLAFELHQRLLDGESDFGDLAKTFSEGPEQESHGKVGPVPLNQAHPILAEKLRASTPGELWKPFFIDEAWIILRLDDWSGARLDEDTRLKMLEELFQDWLNQRVQTLLYGKQPTPLPLHRLNSTYQKDNEGFDSREGKILGTKQLQSGSEINTNESKLQPIHEPMTESDGQTSDDNIGKQSFDGPENHKDLLSKSNAVNENSRQAVEPKRDELNHSDVDEQTSEDLQRIEHLETESQFHAKSYLKESAEDNSIFPSKIWRDGWQDLVQKHPDGLIAFAAMDELLDEVLHCMHPCSLDLNTHLDAIWRRGVGGLFNDESGLLIEGTYPFRYLRKRQCPSVTSFKLELTCDPSELASLDKVLYLPRLSCRTLHELITETLPFAWPLFNDKYAEEMNGRVVIATADQRSDPWLGHLDEGIRKKNAFLCLSKHLPSVVRLHEAKVPTPLYVHEGGVSPEYLDVIDGWIEQHLGPDEIEKSNKSKLFLALDPPKPRYLAFQSSLISELSNRGWNCLSVKQDGLEFCLRNLASANVVVSFDPTIAWLCNSNKFTQKSQELILIGLHSPTFDVFQLARLRQLSGTWIALDPASLIQESKIDSSVRMVLNGIESLLP